MHKEIKLDNQLVVVYENLPHVRSVSFGIWVGAGSRDETLQTNGISHLIEHMVFKGTKTRTAKQIACEFDGIGGQINAFTGKDCTCFYTKTLDTDLALACEILSDMLFNSLFDRTSLMTERKVIFEEINMYEDEPEEMAHDLLDETIWNGSMLGCSILGTRQSLNGINKKVLLNYMDRLYRPDNCVISVVGQFDENKLLSLIAHYFGAWKPAYSSGENPVSPAFRAGFAFKRKKTEQTHICLGFEGVAMADDRTYPLLILNNILGGGMSSRLFQNIREERGLVYSIYSYPTTYCDAGLFSIYAGTNPDKADEVTGLIHEELDRILMDGISEGEMTRSKNQLRGSFLLSLDSVTGRMTSMGKSRLIGGLIKTPEEILKSIEKVSYTDVMEMAQILFAKGSTGIAVLGPSDISPRVRELFL